MNNRQAGHTAGSFLGVEVVRGQLAGLLAGSLVGVVLATMFSAEPLWHESTVWVALIGVLLGGMVGVVAGFVAGVTLRFRRGPARPD